MKFVTRISLLFGFSVWLPAIAGELDLKPPVDVPKEWRDLGNEYRTRLDRLRDDRKERGEKRKTVAGELDSIDFAKTSEQAQQDFAEGYSELVKSSGEAGVEYFKGAGKRSGVLKAGEILLSETLPAFQQMHEAMYAEVDMQYHADDLQRDVDRYDREIAKIDKEIKEVEKNAELSDKIADLYEKIDRETRESARPKLSKLRQAATSARQSAQIKHDTVPAGWLPCTCPGAHANFGRVINGTRYHAPDTFCPR